MFKSMKIKSLLFFAALMASTFAFAQDVSDTQLAQFADAYLKMQAEGQAGEQKMIAVIEEEGLNVERFTQIQQAGMNPNQEQALEITPDELKKHTSALAKLEQMQPELERNIIKEIESTGMSLDQYETLASAIQQDADLQQKLQTILLERMQRQ